MAMGDAEQAVLVDHRFDGRIGRFHLHLEVAGRVRFSGQDARDDPAIDRGWDSLV